MAQDLAKDKTQVWNLEKAYWEYVKANDLESAAILFVADFFYPVDEDWQLKIRNASLILAS
jgi:hypothetical protein